MGKRESGNLLEGRGKGGGMQFLDKQTRKI